MKDKHIIHILDENSLNAISADLMTEIRSHTFECDSCRQAFQAAMISAALLKVSAMETVQPSPFFQTRVMAALREKQVKSVAAFWRWWQASSSVVSAMVVIVAILVALTLFAPNNQTIAAQEQPVFNNLSAETVILNQNLDNELTTGQTLQVIYEGRR
jgi:anti-sigma factor RsiW